MKELDYRLIFILRDKFIKKHFDFTLYESQTAFSNDMILSFLGLIDEPVAQERSRQSGKSFVIDVTICFLVIFWNSLRTNFDLSHLTKTCEFIYFGPQAEQVKTNFDRVKSVLRSLIGGGNPYGLSFQEANGNTLKLSNGNVIYCFSLSPTSNPESKTSNGNVYEEAQKLEDQRIEDVAEPMLASTAGGNVFNGTSGYKLVKFYKVLNSSVVRRHSYNHEFIIKEKREAFERDGNLWHLNYEKFIKRKIAEIGFDSDSFQTQYALKWILERGMFIVRDRLLKLQSAEVPFINPKTGCKKCVLMARGETSNALELEHDVLWSDYVDVGIDWGKVNDRTAVVVKDRKRKWLISFTSYIGDEYPVQIESIAEYLSHFKVNLVCCDATVSQDNIVGFLRNNTRYDVEGVVFSASNKDIMYKNLQRWVLDKKDQDGKVIAPAVMKFPLVKDNVHVDRFIQEFSDLQKETTSGGKLKCAHPDGDYHDDYPDGTALAFWPDREDEVPMAMVYADDVLKSIKKEHGSNPVSVLDDVEVGDLSDYPIFT